MTRSLLCGAIILALGIHSSPTLGQATNTIYFNQNNLDSDTEGNFAGSVSMVQNVIMPTKNKLPGDVQQRPISLRKTMVLFKPQLEFGVGEDINLTAKDKRGRTVYTATMRPPEQLTRPAGQFTIDLPQADYDLVIDDAAAMKKLETDPNGSHMASLLARHDSINIHTMDSIWSPNFYLPKGQFNGKTITLSDHATFNSKVFFNDTSITSKRGDNNSWTHIDGRWRLNASLADPLAPQTEFSLVIEDPESMQTFGNDPEGEHFAKLLDRHDHINIRTHNGIWTRNFYLPKGAQYHNKTVSFHHFAGFSSDIHYNNTTTNISIGDKVTWVNINGVWASVLDREFNRIRYSDNTFSAILPAAIMRPGLSLHFSSGNLNGHISQLNIGAPNELIIHTIDIGMLAPPRNKFTFQNAPELHRQYLQTMPARKLTVSHYQTLQLDQVMLPDGRLLTDYDPSKGGAFEGEMRNKIGKLLISHGIDNANYGLNSSGGLHEIWHPFASPQYTAHNSQGNYINGLQIHGLSGGNGMVTLAESTGNEFSHELGHNYGMGHFPGGFVGSINAPADKVNSTWGWDSDHDFFVPNFEKRISNLDMCYAGQCSAPFMGRRFNAGAMSGGWPLYKHYNSFTLYTPYELALIQADIESKALFSPDSPTGFFKWDSKNKVMRPWLHLATDDLNRHIKNRRVMRRPYKKGIAVTTIVAYYDPDKALQSYIYPALHGSFGAVYKDSYSPSRCQLSVDTQAGPQTYYLHDRRLDGEAMNKVHVNIDAALYPSRAEISCDNEILDSRELEGPSQALSTSVVSAD